MNYLLSRMADGAYVIAVEDTYTWDVPSYTNLYVLQRNGQTILIDAGLKQYQPAIIAALAEIGVTPAQVTHILLTHGHHDHVEGAECFGQARKFVHADDLPFLPAPLASQFAAYAPLADGFRLTAAGLSDFAIIFVNTHSPGSVAIYDHITKALFVGDFFCYFGEALPAGELVSASDYIRRGSCQYVAGQAAAGGTEFASFITGLGRLRAYQPDFFCTGHGVVLRDDIQDFINQLWLSGTRNRQG
ncbi:MBL fold metallo-hydrolase [Sporomusa termitida]|uniref:Hydroxyacylglutathione hydrolase n=1 Tax=Sporomusa termitida TaxID=2377 RepID=A0A517DY08_9FIRM|nr:MBL fold metallo-hydrolase [Sporomusa termitida]QDR82239.1 Hydroxyacylglutathione hydrolase [Sporomusa termitida]